MATYRRVYDSRHLQADCQVPVSAPEPYARQSSTGYVYLFTTWGIVDPLKVCGPRVRKRTSPQTGRHRDGDVVIMASLIALIAARR